MRHLPCLLSLVLSGPAALAAQSGFDLDGGVYNDAFGFSIATTGDLNSDGYPDLLVGAPGEDGGGNKRGAIRLISGFDGSLLRLHTGSNDQERLGHVVASAGDHNGDGVPDYAATARRDNPYAFPTGLVRIWSGADGSLLREFSSNSNWDQFGQAIADLGDLNADGYDDFAIGAPDDDWAGLGAGAVVVYSGFDGSALHTLRGRDPWDQFGVSILGLGDMDGDNLPDFAIGAPLEEAGGKDSGTVSIYSGATGQRLLRIKGRGPQSFFGTAIAALNDVNNDGIPDLGISGVNDSTNIQGIDGYVQIISGSDGAVLATIEQENAAERFGIALASVDLNGDGYQDLLVGAPGAGVFGGSGLGSGAVRAYSGPSGRPLFSRIGTGTSAQFGSSIAGLADLNGDGFNDFAASAPGTGAGLSGGGNVKSFYTPEFSLLQVSNLVSGQIATLNLSGGFLFTPYNVQATISGPGNASSLNGPGLDLAEPLLPVGTMTTDASGQASLTAQVPASSTGIQIWLQAWAASSSPMAATRMLTAVIQ
jgi:FG-GAP repeat